MLKIHKKQSQYDYALKVEKCFKKIKSEVNKLKFTGGKDYKDVMIGIVIEDCCKKHRLNSAIIRKIYFGKVK